MTDTGIRVHAGTRDRSCSRLSAGVNNATTRVMLRVPATRYLPTDSVSRGNVHANPALDPFSCTRRNRIIVMYRTNRLSLFAYRDNCNGGSGKQRFTRDSRPALLLNTKNPNVFGARYYYVSIERPARTERACEFASKRLCV